MTVHYSYPGGKDLSSVCINSKWTIGISTLFQCVLWDSKGSQVFICGYNFPNKLVGRQIFHNTEVVRDRTTVAKLGEFRTVVVYICYQYCQVAFWLARWWPVVPGNEQERVHGFGFPIEGVMQSRDAAGELVDFEVVRAFDEAASWAIAEAVRHDVAVLISGADIGYQDSNVLVLKRD